MKVKATSYMHEPGVSLFLVPETEVERTLLRSMWAHGTLEICNGVIDGSGEGFSITMKRTDGNTDSNVQEPD